MKKLTEKQKKLLDFIESFIRREGMAPTVYEIADKFGIKTSTVFAHLRTLQRKNQLTRSSKARSISLSRHTPGTRAVRGAVVVPVYRDLRGTPAESGDLVDGEQTVNKSMFPDTYDIGFGLRVKDEAMRELGLLAGDVVLCAPERAPRPGDLVVAVVDGASLLRSCFPKDDGSFELRAANPAVPVVIGKAENTLIAGVAVAMLRNF